MGIVVFLQGGARLQAWSSSSAAGFERDVLKDMFWRERLEPFRNEMF
jgi:hypothetical protein